MLLILERIQQKCNAFSKCQSNWMLNYVLMIMVPLEERSILWEVIVLALVIISRKMYVHVSYSEQFSR